MSALRLELRASCDSSRQLHPRSLARDSGEVADHSGAVSIQCLPQQRLYLTHEPHGHASLRPYPGEFAQDQDGTRYEGGVVIETLINIVRHLERLGILETDEPNEGGDQNLGATVFEQRGPGVGNQRHRRMKPPAQQRIGAGAGLSSPKMNAGR
jgi:hypothetical protein